MKEVISKCKMNHRRSKERDLAFELWYKSKGTKTTKEIAEELNLPVQKIYKWKCIDDWKAKGKKFWKSSGNSSTKNIGKSIIQEKEHGNIRNQNALKTGEYSKLIFENMSQDEIDYFRDSQIEILNGIDESIKLLAIRESRMLKLISDLKDRQDILIRNIYGYDKSGNQYLKRTEEEIKEITDKIIDIENSLTKIQEKKLKAYESKSRIINSDKLIDLKERQLKLKEW